MGENITPEVASIPFPLSDTDKWVLSQTDEEYQYHTWDDLQNIIRMLNYNPNGGFYANSRDREE